MKFRRILTKSVPFPRTMDETSRDFINGLLTKDPKRRLGAGGVQEIKSHDFFAGIDWEKVQRKEVDPSIKPSLTNNVRFAFCIISHVIEIKDKEIDLTSYFIFCRLMSTILRPNSPINRLSSRLLIPILGFRTYFE